VACRAGYRVLFISTDALLKALTASRADNCFDRELRRFIAPDLVVIDDLASQVFIRPSVIGLCDVDAGGFSAGL
jgi:DNA replication protein DnaC